MWGRRWTVAAQQSSFQPEKLNRFAHKNIFMVQLIRSNFQFHWNYLEEAMLFNKILQFPASLFVIFVFDTVDGIKNLFLFDWFWTVDLCQRKRPLCQLIYDHWDDNLLPTCLLQSKCRFESVHKILNFCSNLTLSSKMSQRCLCLARNVFKPI